MPDDQWTAPPQDVHGWFELSYSSYAVLPRVLMQSMPGEWQHRFTALMGELEEAFEHVAKPARYIVQAAEEHEAGSLDEAQRARAGITEDQGGCEIDHDCSDANGAECSILPAWRDRDGRELQAGEMVLVPVDDPLPHYRRGHVEPRLPQRPAGRGEPAARELAPQLHAAMVRSRYGAGEPAPAEESVAAAWKALGPYHANGWLAVAREAIRLLGGTRRAARDPEGQQVLRMLGNSREMSGRAVARELGVAPMTALARLAALEAAGLVASAKAGKAVMWSLTASGIAAASLPELPPKWGAMREGLLFTRPGDVVVVAFREKLDRRATWRVIEEWESHAHGRTLMVVNGAEAIERLRGGDLSEAAAEIARLSGELARESARSKHYPAELCNCEPGSMTGDMCEYRMLADHVIAQLNPRDGDEAEVSLLMGAITRTAEYVADLPCFCEEGPDGDPCRRCAALGQLRGEVTSR